MLRGRGWNIFMGRMKTVEGELAELKAEVERLFGIYKEKELGLAELQRTVEQFQLRYAHEVAQKQVELDRLTAQLEEIRAGKISTGRPVSRKSAGDAAKRGSSVAGDEVIILDTLSASHSLRDAKEAKRVYRKIAAIIHPDKAKDGGAHELRTKLMAQLNEAYGIKDTLKMKSILEEWNESPESVTGDDTTSELERTRRVIARIKRATLFIETEISRVIASEIYVMMVKVDEGERVGRAILTEMTVELDARIKVARSTLFMRMYA